MIASLLWLISCKDTPAEEAVPSIQTNRDTTTTPVKIAQCREGMFEYRIEANGIIKADKELKLYTDQAGLVSYTIVKNGTHVSNGQPLLKLDTSDLKLKLERAEITRYNATKEFESQQLSYEKLMQDLTGTEKTEINKKLYVSSGLALAEQEIKEIRHTIQKSVLKAPYSGVIADAKPVNGQMIRTGDEICTLLSHTLVIECQILESDLPMIQVGVAADVINIAFPERPVKGIVQEINPIVDPSGMARISIKLLASTSDRLYSGMHGRAIIKIPAIKTLLVPKEAVVIRGNRPVVFTVEGNLAKWNYVEIGRNNGVEIEIISGLTKADQVIVSNNLQLAHEAAIKIE